ncbi:unnamed protein product [Aureobasidium vineae]|uniref:Uncharacterized protein n=1 Tax=Aureobasidium vineae TaxID=2773715 RepID=A0A9N8JD00_9PEZI|nr:unnamed protein product [Aureobasidium vineae]
MIFASCRELLQSFRSNLPTFNLPRCCPPGKCRPDTFQEGNTGVITLPSNPGRQVNALSSPITSDEFDWDLDVEDVKTVRAMIYNFYHHDYHTEPEPELHLDPVGEYLSRGPIAQHARMYAMGEKYGVSGLKALALRKFIPSKMKAVPRLCSAIVVAFMITPDIDQDMRNLIVELLARHPILAKVPYIDQAIREAPVFSMLYTTNFWRKRWSGVMPDHEPCRADGLGTS